SFRLAASVRKGSHAIRKQRSQGMHVATAGRNEERLSNLETALLRHRKSGSGHTHMGSGAARELTARRWLPVECLGDLFEAHAEDVVKEECCALQRGETLQC